jgi:hypothetical protein
MSLFPNPFWKYNCLLNQVVKCRVGDPQANNAARGSQPAGNKAGSLFFFFLSPQ